LSSNPISPKKKKKKETGREGGKEGRKEGRREGGREGRRERERERVRERDWAQVVLACNSSYSGGRDQEDFSLKPGQIVHKTLSRQYPTQKRAL
jgi:hypothetical protein